MARLLVTGANGFVGRVLVEEALQNGYEVTAAVRGERAREFDARVRTVTIGDLGADTRWDEALRDVELVVHAAGRAHVMHEHAADPLAEFRRVNVEGTRALARQAAERGVRRLVFVSSIKVNGEQTDPESGGFRETDSPNPGDPYGVSKLEAERLLATYAERGTLETVVVRPPLVFGAGVRANFLGLMRWIDRGRPLPLGLVRNRRSLVSVWNLASLLLACASHGAASGQLFLASDERAVSSPELVRLIASALGRRAALLPVPESALKLAGALVGKRQQLKRLCGSLEVDANKARQLLGWTPPLSLEAGLARTAHWYRSLATP